MLTGGVCWLESELSIQINLICLISLQLIPLAISECELLLTWMVMFGSNSLPLCCNVLASEANMCCTRKKTFWAKYYLQGSDWLKLHWWLAARNPLPTLHRQCRATHFPAVIWKLPATLLTSRLPWTWHASGTPDFMSSLCGQKQNKLTTKPICPPRPKCQSALWSQNAAARKALWIKHNGKNKLK